MASDAHVTEGENGRGRAPLLRTLERHAEETGAWIDAITDEATLESVVEAELALVQRATRRQQTLRRAAATRAAAEEAEEWIGIEELSRMIHRSISWIRHQPRDDIPGRRQHVVGGRVEWNRRIVQGWLAALTVRP